MAKKKRQTRSKHPVDREIRRRELRLGRLEKEAADLDKDFRERMAALREKIETERTVVRALKTTRKEATT